VNIAAQHFSNSADSFSSFVHPGTPDSISQAASNIPGITNNTVKNALSFKQVVQQFMNCIYFFCSLQDIIIFVAHNCEKFDKSILIAALKGVEIPVPENWRFANTLPMFRKLLLNLGPRRAKPYTLQALYRHFFKQDYDKAHTASRDIHDGFLIHRSTRCMQPSKCFPPVLCM